MGTHRQFHEKSRQTALCGLLAALSVVMLSLGSVIPFLTYVCPLAAMICLLPVVDTYGSRVAFLIYAAAAILGVLLCTDKELACFYVFLGWYPALRPKLERLHKILRAAVKCTLFTAAIMAMYSLLMFLFQMDAVVEELSEYSTPLLIGMLILGNITFLLYDQTLGTLTVILRKKFRK